MDPFRGKTGIVVHAGMATGTRIAGKLLAALHLDGFAAAKAKNAKMVITVDGVERREPFYEAHLVECAPGEHEVTVAVLHEHEVLPIGQIPVPDKRQIAFSSRTVRVTVATGEVTHLTYTPGATSIELAPGGGPQP
jgi:hypothetical protein